MVHLVWRLLICLVSFPLMLRVRRSLRREELRQARTSLDDRNQVHWHRNYPDHLLVASLAVPTRSRLQRVAFCDLESKNMIIESGILPRTFPRDLIDLF